jgi:hypothetical protein
MKHIFRLISVVTLLTSAGCIFPGHRGGGDERGHGEEHGREAREHSEHHGEPGPAVVVRVRED